MTYQPQSEHHRQYERTYRLGMHSGWTQGAKWTGFFPTPILYVVIALCRFEVFFMVLDPAGEL